VRGLAKKILQRLGYLFWKPRQELTRWQFGTTWRRGNHLLVTDMVMPDGITGRDLVEKLQAKRPA